MFVHPTLPQMSPSGILSLNWRIQQIPLGESNIARIGQTYLGYCWSFWTICMVNLLKRYAWKLRSAVPSWTSNFRSAYGRTLKPLIFTISGLWDVSLAHKVNDCLSLETPGCFVKIQEQSQIILKISCYNKYLKCVSPTFWKVWKRQAPNIPDDSSDEILKS